MCLFAMLTLSNGETERVVRVQCAENCENAHNKFAKCTRICQAKQSS